MEYKRNAEKIVEFLELNAIDEIVTPCPGCYRTLKDIKKTVKVVHTVEKFAELIDKLNVAKLSCTVTYHDPCELGRFCGIFDAPRKVLETISNFVEMNENRFESNCCGAGGALLAVAPHISERIALTRIDDALNTGAEILATACPYCEIQLKSVAKGRIKVRNIADLIKIV
jgi:Fe-S oxidoreductase